jgi:glyoxylase-like metal-dependent hydrolase (beta-lactamase superfamily II)
MSAHTVALPGPKTYAAALATTITGAIRPKRPDRRFLDSLSDVGLPEARTAVRIRPLRQVPSEAPSAFIVEGRRHSAKIRMGMTTFLVEHPDATFLVDPSICEDVGRRALSELPAVLRKAVEPPKDIVPIRDMLSEVGLGPEDIAFALPTHLHWDHVSGLLDLPGLEIKAHDIEWDWAMGTSIAPSAGVRASLVDRPVDTYDLDGPPVLTFTRSHDLLGDGSVLLVDLAGHSPGSVGVLLSTTRGPVLIAGDAAWHSTQIEDIRQKAGFPGCLVDNDRRETFRTLHRLHAARHSATILPTHDHDATSAYAATG